MYINSRTTTHKYSSTPSNNVETMPNFGGAFNRLPKKELEENYKKYGKELLKTKKGGSFTSLQSSTNKWITLHIIQHESQSKVDEFTNEILKGETYSIDELYQMLFVFEAYKQMWGGSTKRDQIEQLEAATLSALTFNRKRNDDYDYPEEDEAVTVKKKPTSIKSNIVQNIEFPQFEPPKYPNTSTDIFELLLKK